MVLPQRYVSQPPTAYSLAPRAGRCDNRPMTQQQPLAVGDRAPDFTLPSSLGRPVALAEYLERGPVVLAWYLFDFGRV